MELVKSTVGSAFLSGRGRLGRWLIPLLSAQFLVFSGCSSDRNCSAFDFEPDPAVILLENDGQEVCELLSVSVTNVRFPEEEAPVAEERMFGFNERVLAIAYNELCELRVAAWYDGEIDEPLELSLEVTAMVDGEEVTFEPVDVEFDVLGDGCGGVAAERQTVELELR